MGICRGGLRFKTPEEMKNSSNPGKEVGFMLFIQFVKRNQQDFLLFLLRFLINLSSIFPPNKKKKSGKEIKKNAGNSTNLTYNKQNYTPLSFKLWLPSIKVSFRCIN